ncbi:hypothetical protein Tco_0583523 [Tanacetum coccineum]
MQSSSISSDFASKFLNLDNVPPADNEVASMMNVKVSHKESRTQAPSFLIIPVTAIPISSIVAATTILPKEISDFATLVIQSTINESLENVVLAKSSSQPQSTYEAALDKDLFDSNGKVYSLKRGCEDKDKDKDPPAGPDQGLKKRKMSKDVEPLKGSKSKESKSSSSKGTKSQPKTSSKSVQAEDPVFETTDIEMPQDQGGDLGNTEDQPKVEEASKHDWFKKPERPPTPDPD